MSIRAPATRFLDPERSRFSRATLTLLGVSAWINNFLALLFWVGLQLNNLGVWADANLFWFVVLLVFAPLFIGVLGILWQVLSIPLVLIAASIYWIWAEVLRLITGSGSRDSSFDRAEARRAARETTHPEPSTARAPGADVKSIAEVLRELAQLHDEGILSDEEYEARRRRHVEQL